MQTFESLAVGEQPKAEAPGVEEYLLDQSPEAALRVELPEAQIVVVAAKRPGGAWDKAARAHIEEARASYRLWGDVPLWDHFDLLESTSHYIGYVLYPTADGRLEREAITGRLVREQPEDVAFYAVEDRPLADVLDERLAWPVAGDSRIGALRPRHARCNAYTVETFAAVRLAMMSEARADGLGYVACQLRPNLQERVLNKRGVRFDFPRTEALLEVPRGSVRLNRSNPTVLHHMFSYPGYFLDADQLQKILQCRVGCDTQFAADQLFRLAPILTGSSDLSARLRALVAQKVADGVYSSVVRSAEYQDRAWSVLNKLGAKVR